MLTIPNYLVKIGEAIWLRVTIALFFYLSLMFGRMFVSVGAHDHPYLGVICPFFFEATGIIIFNLLYGKYSVGRDINALSSFGLIFTFIYLLFYFAGINASVQQNLIANVLNGLIVLRCVYMTERDLFAVASPIGQLKKWLLNRYWFVNAYINALTVAVFALCAVPLFVMMYLINTDQMRASGIAVILFAFFVAFENAKRYAALDAAVADVEPVALDEASIEAEQHAMFIARFVYFVVACSIAYAVGVVADDKERFFNVGYASGYADAKSGAAPKKETDFEKALWCNMVKLNGQANPPGMQCDNPNH
jgi:hypothetical protein